MRKLMAVFLVCMLLAASPAHATSSWSQISEELVRPEGWRQIVARGEFVLGDREAIDAGTGIDVYEQAYGSYPSIDGSTVCVPMALEFARQHLTLSEADLSGFVYFSTTHGAYEHLIGREPNGSAMLVESNAAMDPAHPVDIILATAPSDEELMMAEVAGVTLTMQPVCYDAFVFITHVDNPVDSLTANQIRAIYRGEITNWSDAGGEDRRINAIQREKNSGSQTAMEQMVMQGEGMISNRWSTSDFMADLIGRVGDYYNGPGSLGYTYLYYLENLYPDEAVKVLAVDGVYPTDEAVRSGEYPFAVHYYAVIRKENEEGVAGRFLAWMLSDEGQASIKQAGYIPMEAGDGQ